MKYCARCGKAAESNNLTTCSYCGGKLKDEIELREKPKKNVAKNVITVLVVVVLAGVIAVCCFMAGQLYNNNKESKETKTIVYRNDDISEGNEETKEKSKENNDEETVPESETDDTGVVYDEFDQEDEIKRIREKQTAVEEGPLTKVEGYGNANAYYDNAGNLVKIDVQPDSALGYSRIYYFENGELYFAFVFSGAEVENRFYFRSEKMFRWKYGTKDNQEDRGSVYSGFDEWEETIKADAKAKLSMF